MRQARHFDKAPIVAAMVLLAGSLAAQPAFAQAAAAPAAAASAPATESPQKIETVVISAERRMERLQDVPMAVSAFTSKQIEATGIASTQDFINLVPNMSFDNSFTYGNSFVVLRGVTEINNADSPVAVVVDGVPQNNQKQLKMDLFDVERIEVLKGPQGALYGRNAIGGAINIETKQPTDKLEGYVGLTVGQGGLVDATSAISGAIVPDKVMFRISADGKHSDGQITNTYLNEKVDGIKHDDSLRAKLLLFPFEGLRIDLRASTSNYNAGATWDSIVVDSNPASIYLPRSDILGQTTGQTGEASAKIEYDMPFARLTSITGYTDLTENYRGDLDFSNPVDMPKGFLGLGFQAGQGQNLSVRMLSQELRLTSPDDKPLRWIAGVYGLDTHRGLQTRAFVDLNGSIAQIDNPAQVIIDESEADHNKASAVFGQLDVDFAGSFTLSTGLRLDQDHREQTDLVGGGTREASYSKWQPKVTLTDKFSRDTLAYATASTGFRSGGFNAPGIADFAPESLTNLEVGYKTVLLGGTLMLNTALYQSTDKGFQFFYVSAATGSQIISNIDRVRLQGGDMDFRWQATRSLQFDGGIGITDSRILADSAEPDAVGNHTPKTVPFKTNLGAQYEQPIGDGLEATLRADWEHRDRKFWHPDNVAVSPAIDLLGLRVGVRQAQDRWSVTLVGKNLTNKLYYADYNAAKYSGLPYDIGSLAPPRWIGIEGKVRF